VEQIIKHHTGSNPVLTTIVFEKQYKQMEDFKVFLINLFKQLSTGDFTVNVDCADDKQFSADVIGYSEEYMTIEVRFHSDELTKPGRREVKQVSFGYSIGDDDVIMEDCIVPVKVERIWWESIKLK
jgi:hypothetical protein